MICMKNTNRAAMYACIICPLCTDVQAADVAHVLVASLPSTSIAVKGLYIHKREHKLYIQRNVIQYV